MNSLDFLFNPKSVAIFGASNEQGKVGTLIMNNIVACGYLNNVYPINPNPKYKDKEILGYRTYASIQEVPEQADLGVVIVPSKFVKNTLTEIVKYGVKSAILISAGFGEVGEEGKRNELELVQIAENGNMNFIGPNTMGLWSSNVSLNICLGYISPLPGEISLISQSGSTGVVICSELRGMGIGIRYYVSSGNEACLTFEDYLEYFINDEKTKVIAGFLEGFRNAEKFLEICKKNVKKKPIIILKAGTTKAGTKAASSHTGSITGSIDVYDAVFRQYGVIKANNIDQLLDLIRAFYYLKPVKGNRVAIIPGAGGMGVLTADACDRVGLDVAKPSQNLIDNINKILPFYWSHSNPFDPVGSQDMNVYPNLLELILESNEYDYVITNVIEIQSLLDKYFPQHEEGKQIKNLMKGVLNSVERSVARKEIKLYSKHEKPVIFISHIYPYANLFRIFEKKNALIVKNPDAAAFILKNLIEFSKENKR